jgi:hypothetical protein
VFSAEHRDSGLRCPIRRYRLFNEVVFDEADESPFVGLLQVEAVSPRRHDAGERMAGSWAESETTVWLGGEVTAVAVFAG